MDNIVVGKLLICFLVIIANARFFYIKHSRVDSLCMIIPVAFFLLLLDIIAHGVDFFSAGLFVLLIISLFTNLRAFMRFCENLYVDRYSVPFVVASFLVVAFTVIIAVLLVYFSPAKIAEKNFSVRENTIRMSGSFRSGLTQSTTFEKASAIVTVVAPDEDEKKDDTPVVVLLCDKRADSAGYKPYMMLLAERGYTVIAADFYSGESKFFGSVFDARFLRRFWAHTLWYFGENIFDSRQSNYTRIITQEAAALIKIAQLYCGAERKIFFVGDGMADEACYIASQTNSQFVDGYFLLGSVAEYKSAGFGFVEQTNPFLAHYFFGLERDKNFSAPRIAAEKTDEIIKEKI